MKVYLIRHGLTDAILRILSNSMLTDLVACLKSAVQPPAADVKPRIVYLNREWRDWGN